MFFSAKLQYFNHHQRSWLTDFLADNQADKCLLVISEMFPDDTSGLVVI